MRRPVNHSLVERLLQDESLSYREIARRANCSEWSVRSIARRYDGSRSSDSTAGEPLTLSGWATGIGVALLIFGGLWLISRRPPPSSESM
jgi:hypothetical protein